MNSGRLFRVLNTPNRVTVAVSMVTFGVGLGVGYLLGKRDRLEVEFHEIPEKLELDLTKDDLTQARKDAKTKRGTVVIPAMERPTKIVVEQIHDEDVKDFITIDGKVTPVIVDAVKDELKKASPEDETIVKSVFGETGPDWDYEFEKTQRTSQIPYILHIDEFTANELDYTQITLTYYAGDDVLVDDHDVPLYDYQSLTGPLKFGHGSLDPNIVYVRNMRHRAEYEVVFDEGLYSVEVMGEDMPNSDRVKHVQHSKIKRFRSDD